MDISNILIYFLAGGATVAAAVTLAESGSPILSGLAILFPATTLASYFFTGKSAGDAIAYASIKSTIASSLVVWLPYMITLAYFTPKVGVNKALAYGVLIYLLIGTIWTFANNRYRII